MNKKRKVLVFVGFCLSVSGVIRAMDNNVNLKFADKSLLEESEQSKKKLEDSIRKNKEKYVQEKKEMGWTDLHFAVDVEDDKEVERLIKEGKKKDENFSCDPLDKNGRSPLYYLIKKDLETDAVRHAAGLLIKGGADLYKEGIDFDKIVYYDFDGKGRLLRDIQYDHLSKITDLMSEDKFTDKKAVLNDLFARFPDGSDVKKALHRIALAVVIVWDLTEDVKALFETWGDVGVEEEIWEHHTLLGEACVRRNIDLIKYLVDVKKANINGRSGGLTLLQALFECRSWEVDNGVVAFYYLRCKNTDKDEKKLKECIKFLLERGDWKKIEDINISKNEEFNYCPEIIRNTLEELKTIKPEQIEKIEKIEKIEEKKIEQVEKIEKIEKEEEKKIEQVEEIEKEEEKHIEEKQVDWQKKLVELCENSVKTDDEIVAELREILKHDGLDLSEISLKRLVKNKKYRCAELLLGKGADAFPVLNQALKNWKQKKSDKSKSLKALIKSAIEHLEQSSVTPALLNKRDSDGKTVLHHVADHVGQNNKQTGEWETVIKIMLNKGANPSIWDAFGYTALDYAENDKIRVLLKDRSETWGQWAARWTNNFSVGLTSFLLFQLRTKPLFANPVLDKLKIPAMLGTCVLTQRGEKALQPGYTKTGYNVRNFGQKTTWALLGAGCAVLWNEFGVKLVGEAKK